MRVQRLFLIVLLTTAPAYARKVRSDLDLKFYEITSYNQPPQYIGFTSSRVDNFVSVPSGDGWYVRPDGHMNAEGYEKLIEEMKSRRFPGLDLSDRWDVTDQTIAGLQGLETLRILRLNNTKVKDIGLAVLSTIPGLKALSLNNQTTNAGLRRVRDIKRLESLDVHHTQITDAGLVALKDLPHLEALDLSGTSISDAGAKTLAELTRLKQLDVSDTPMTDKGIVLLQTLPRLETLYVSGHMTNKGLKAVAGLKKLRNLDISGAHVTDGGLSALAGASHLEALALSDTRVGDEGLTHVSKLKNLKTLELSDTRVSRDGLSALSGMPHLETLSLSWTALTDTELQALADLPHLTRVILNGRTLAPKILSHIRTMALLNKPRHVPAVSLEHRVVAGVAPASHPGGKINLPAPVSASIPATKPRLRPGGDVVTRPVLPPDLPPSPTAKPAIATDFTPKGKGMIIEVGAAPEGRTGNGKALKGLKRIYQAELAQSSHDPDLAPGESSQITFPKETAENSLGEIEVQPARRR